MAQKGKSGPHEGLKQLCACLGPQFKARGGVLSPEKLGLLCGVNPTTMNELRYGKLHFQADTPMNKLILEALVIATGVSRDMRNYQKPRIAPDGKPEPIKDVWGNPYSLESYKKWQAFHLHHRAVRHVTGRAAGYKTINPLQKQAHFLVDLIFRASKKKSVARELICGLILKHALVDAAKKLGVLGEQHGYKIHRTTKKPIPDPSTVCGMNLAINWKSIETRKARSKKVARLPLHDITLRFPQPPSQELQDATSDNPIRALWLASMPQSEPKHWNPDAPALIVDVESPTL
ncbi:MAG: hypothetical protein LV480_02965 [Methylacidiphilales bacterium]|nr:hypothetical protein [Candidatus Methylacidiphilales bacterium]